MSKCSRRNSPKHSMNFALAKQNCKRNPPSKSLAGHHGLVREVVMQSQSPASGTSKSVFRNRCLRNTTFRANPDYELILLDNLPSDQKKALRNLRRDPDFHGLLRSRNGLTTKTLC